MKRALLWMALAGCGAPSSSTTGVELPTGVRTWASDLTPSGGILTAQGVAPADSEPVLGEPVATGLSFEATDTLRTERAGDDLVLTQVWRFTGSKGHYRIDGPELQWTGGGLAQPSPLYLDLGVEAPRTGELMEITEPGAVRPFPWVPVGIGGGVLLLFGLGVAFAFKPRRPPAAAAPLPPDEAALAAWRAARRDPSLDDHGRALAISGIFRTYAEAVLAFPATAWTTSEILAHLRGLPHLADTNLPRAKALLRATDRVKFAEADVTDELFDELGADLEAFVRSTAPRRLKEGR